MHCSTTTKARSLDCKEGIWIDSSYSSTGRRGATKESYAWDSKTISPWHNSCAQTICRPDGCARRQQQSSRRACTNAIAAHYERWYLELISFVLHDSNSVHWMCSIRRSTWVRVHILSSFYMWHHFFIAYESIWITEFTIVCVTLPSQASLHFYWHHVLING